MLIAHHTADVIGMCCLSWFLASFVLCCVLLHSFALLCVQRQRPPYCSQKLGGFVFLVFISNCKDRWLLLRIPIRQFTLQTHNHSHCNCSSYFGAVVSEYPLHIELFLQMISTECQGGSVLV